MIKRPQSWYALLRRRRRAFLRFLHESGARESSLAKLADDLIEFLKARITTPQAAEYFWAAVLPTLAKCGSQATYELPFAPEAYAWLHLLDRYVRTWYALQRMIQGVCFPLAKNGVNTLDIGTGPGPSVLAVGEFYRSLSDFGSRVGEPRLVQPCRITEVELSLSNNMFRSHFREFAQRQVEMSFMIPDLNSIEPKGERVSLRHDLSDEECWGANDRAQSLHRYRLIVLSNFITDLDDFGTVRPALLRIFNDLQPGSIVVIIGAEGAHYPQLYESLDRLASEAGLRRRIAGRRVFSRGGDRKVILRAAREIAAHVSSLAPMPADVEAVVKRALEGRQAWGRPSAIRVYRRNRRRAAA